MVNAMKMLVFKGIRTEESEKFCFFANTVLTTQQIIDYNIKKEQLVTTLQDCMLTWYIKCCYDNPLAYLTETKKTFNKDFSKPKSNSQLVVGFKEILVKVDETTWEFD